MSYDFDLYTSRRYTLEPPPESATGKIYLDGPDQIEDEDISPSHLRVLGRKRVLYRIHLTGDWASRNNTSIDAWLAAILSSTKGVLIDLQTERFETLTKSGWLAAASAPEPRSGWMKFFFEDGEAFYERGYENMLNVALQLMPEAAPTRYGYYEPLQGRVDNGDSSKLIFSFKTDPEVFMRSRTPFGYVFVNVPCKKTFEKYHRTHFIRREFLLGYLEFELRPILFSQPANLARLMTLFEKLCVELNVVYAEIVETNKPGSWFWYGLPNNQAHTVCLGAAYQQVWPAFMSSGTAIGDHHHVVTTDRLGNRPPEPPIELVAPIQEAENEEPETMHHRDGRPGASNFASVFPFGYEFHLNRYVW